MVKKVYIPSSCKLKAMDGILCKNGLGKSAIFKYMLAKEVEVIVAQGGLEFFNEDIKEDTVITSKVINFIPSDIWCTSLSDNREYATSVVLKNYHDTSSKYGLDYLDCISSSLYRDSAFVASVLDKLVGILDEDPSYRFSYEGSMFLNKVFDCKLLDDLKLDDIYRTRILKLLTNIEPAYMLKYDLSLIKNGDGSYHDSILDEALEKYASRYGFYLNYHNKLLNEDDSLTNLKSIRSKKLVKFFEDNK